MTNYNVVEESQEIDVREFGKRYKENLLGTYSTISEEAFDTLNEAKEAFEKLDTPRIT